MGARPHVCSKKWRKKEGRNGGQKKEKRLYLVIIGGSKGGGGVRRGRAHLFAHKNGERKREGREDRKRKNAYIW